MAGLSFPPVDVKALNLAKTFKGHLMSVSSLAMHPTKPIVVSFVPPKSSVYWQDWFPFSLLRVPQQGLIIHDPTLPL